MVRNLKLLIVFGAVMAMFAALAPAAFAWQFHHEEAGATTTGLPDGKSKIAWTFNVAKFECAEKGEGKAESSESSEELIAETSSECSGPEEAKEVVNGCKYDFVAGMVDFVGTLSLLCPEGAKLEFKEKGCTVTVAEQKGLSSMSFTNEPEDGEGAELEVTAEFKVAKLAYLEDNVAPGNSCKNPGVMQNNGTITGAMLLTEENANKEMKGFWVE